MIIEWDAPEFIRHQRNKNWYGVFIIVAVTFGALAVLFQYWTSLILVIIAGLTILIQIKREPQVIHFSLGEDGLRIDEKFHPFTEFQSFCILEMLENKYLFLTSKNKFSPRLEIPLGDKTLEEIREHLLRHIGEKEEEASFTTIIAHWLRL